MLHHEDSAMRVTNQFQRGFLNQSDEDSLNEFDCTKQLIQNRHSDDFMVEMDEARQERLVGRNDNSEYLLMSNVENAELIYKFAGTVLSSNKEEEDDSNLNSHITSHFTQP